MCHMRRNVKWSYVRGKLKNQSLWKKAKEFVKFVFRQVRRLINLVLVPAERGLGSGWGRATGYVFQPEDSVFILFEFSARKHHFSGIISEKEVVIVFPIYSYAI